jgi:ribonuclease D
MLAVSRFFDVQPIIPTVITTTAGLARLAERLGQAPAVAVDTESNSLYAYHERLCLIQFSLPGEDYIVDPLALNGLGPVADVLTNPAIEKVFHGADYDIVSLKRAYGITLANIFDTMVASRILGRSRYGLAALLHDMYGIVLDKRLQRSDWGHRPLTTAQIQYACQDTRFLLQLRADLGRELALAGREAEAREVFAELTSLEPCPRVFDPDGWWSLRGVGGLDVEEKRVLRALYRWREECASREDRPPFKIVSNDTLIRLSQAQPRTLHDLGALKALSSLQVERYGNGILAAIEAGRHSRERLAKRMAPDASRRLDERAQAVYEALRGWRKRRAAERGVEPDVVVSNDTLAAIARCRPQCLEDLEHIPGLGPWRRAAYGAEILQVVAEVKHGAHAPASF